MQDPTATPQNRLARERSAYLLSHATNPVDWYPWGPEAHERARREDRPILLSVGYSACHWCHVMERESFCDPATAAVMNAHFVCIKVDREERPDVDQVYQLSLQLMGRGGGWPLTAFLLPDLTPFFLGTYYPPEDRHGLPGFRAVLAAVATAFRTRRADVERTARELLDGARDVDAAIPRTRGAAFGAREHAAALAALAARLEDAGGGHGPRFPQPLVLLALFAGAWRHGEESWARLALRELDTMRAGGLWDHLGGGFHRYSVDGDWQVPHFEKMLYDNALLARAYVEGWRAARDPRHEETARAIFDYLEREMRVGEVGYAASQDADSAGREGAYFVWTPEEIRAAVGERDAALVCARFGVSRDGHFDGGATVLSEAVSVGELARREGVDEGALGVRLEAAVARLRSARAARPAPARDGKAIVSWNALLVSALAEAGAAFGDPELLERARGLLGAIGRALWPRERLARALEDGLPTGSGVLDDHAHLLAAALDVHELTGDGDALRLAVRLAGELRCRFWDPEARAFLSAASDVPDLCVRLHDAHDQPTPSGAATAASALLRLHERTGDLASLELAEQALVGLGERAAASPWGMASTLLALDRVVYGPTTAFVVGDASDALAAGLAAEAVAAPLASRTLWRAARGAPLPPGVEASPPPDGTWAMLCTGRACGPRMRDREGWRAALRGRGQARARE